MSDDIEYLERRIASIAASLRDVADWTTRAEKPNPQIISLSSPTGATGNVIFARDVSTVRLRVSSIILANGNNNAVMSLNIGAFSYRWVMAIRNVIVLPFPIVLEPGVDVSAVSSVASGEAIAIYIIGYPERRISVNA